MGGRALATLALAFLAIGCATGASRPSGATGAVASFPRVVTLSYGVRMGTTEAAEAAMEQKRAGILAVLAAAGLSPSAMRVTGKTGFIGPFPSESRLDTGEIASNGFVDMAESAEIEVASAKQYATLRTGLRKLRVEVWDGRRRVA